MKHLDIEAWVTVDEQPLDEFGVATHGMKASCWIASEVGMHFEVHFRSNRSVNVNGDFYIDGQLSDSGVVTEDEEGREYIASGLLTSLVSEKPFVFSEVRLTDDDGFSGRDLQELGEIKIVFEEVHIIKEDIPFDENVHCCKFSSEDLLHERSSKAITHRVGLGEERGRSKEDFMTFEAIRVIATFAFKYRPIEFLRANDVAPGSTSNGKKRQILLSDGIEKNVPTHQPQQSTSSSQEPQRKKLKSEASDQVTPPQAALMPARQTTSGPGPSQVANVASQLSGDAQAMPFEALIPSTGPVTKVSVATFGEKCQDDVDEEIISKLMRNGYKKMRTLRRLTIEKLQMMGFSHGEVDTLLDVVADFVEGFGKDGDDQS
ncbi:hypothetical protein D9758_014291 [Tetrapyrgos nigripes]|uniref:DUF7918 domain-containing protein n=1 Tax=Tetrapyrgos nigripes TaxID=182062 RepID=A0A8H5C420_9AGAR|nr:hypothetical protein D9758_014291 [Tetrapyrgos nigripes]